jgi:1-acyl-sn-glycerol-3-phosphate acyltransferase
LYVERSTQDARDAIIEQIGERQSAIEDRDEAFNKLCLFPEGTTSNGTCILKFKKGAFHSMRTVIPVYLKIYPEDPTVGPEYCTIDYFKWLIFAMSSFQPFHAKLTIMPPFTPNQHMLKT